MKYDMDTLDKMCLCMSEHTRVCVCVCTGINKRESARL